MNDSKMKAEINKLKSMINRLDRVIKDSPEGWLRIASRSSSKDGNRILQFYQVTEIGDNIGKYIRKDQQDLVKALAQKDYCEKLKKAATEKLEYLSAQIKLKDLNLGKVYENLNDYRKKLVIPLVESDDMFIERWLGTPYVKKGFKEDDEELFTKKGERVRSKSEILIANALENAGIPYKYECPVVVQGQDVFVDFTILQPETRKVFYWEHFGMMDSEKYLKDFMWKMSEYPKCGLIPGDNLIMTFESSFKALNTKTIDLIINKLVGH